MLMLSMNFVVIVLFVSVMMLVYIMSSGIVMLSVSMWGRISCSLCGMFIMCIVLSFLVMCIMLICVVIVEFEWFVMRIVDSMGLSL